MLLAAAKGKKGVFESFFHCVSTLLSADSTQWKLSAALQSKPKAHSFIRDVNTQKTNYYFITEFLHLLHFFPTIKIGGLEKLSLLMIC